ncbi:hypothetical protein MNBD_ALPHA03-413 [hydrothermal vent metagenome]|uniref:Ice-binding protein C-terminal domain-containing protein n=1 Tax=hydrothermal vent metagenome TaxID=652676 RepID=A0A3B1B8P4_9ZZZZ
MTFKKIFLTAGIIAAGAISASASTIIVDNAPGTPNGTSGAFSYIGKGSPKDYMGGSRYDIYSMEVSRVNGLMTVKINTRFVDYNTQNDIDFGDLFMSTEGVNGRPVWDPTGDPADGYKADNSFTTGTQWDYVYDLNRARKLTGNNINNTSARLYELNDYDLADPHDADNFKYGTSRDPGTQLYRVKNERAAYANAFSRGSVETNIDNDYLQFVFDVSGTQLATAEQIAFRWTMSCANDIIEGVVDFAAKVPEPAALGLLLLGLAGVGFARRRARTT